MRYRRSAIDEKNFKWFDNDITRATLKAIHLEEGRLRGLSPFMVEFEYPIAAFAGENGSGKSTLLALASCAYHNRSSGYKQIENKRNYYTFSDFKYISFSD